jgi:hypothetical protein
MKCTHCLALNTSGDTTCFGCGAPLAVQRQATATPGWAYVFAVACGLIPVVALGGCVPVALGIGGASGCLQVSRSRSIPGALRVGMCVGITFICWVLFGALIVAIAAATRQ